MLGFHPVSTQPISTLEVAAGGNNTLAAPLGTLTLTGLVPTFTQGNSLTAPLGTLTLTGLVPTITQGNSVTAPLGTLTLTGLVPTFTQPINLTAVLGTMTLTGLVPTFDQGGNQSITAPLGTLTLQGLVGSFAQTVTPVPNTGTQGGGRGRKQPSYEDWQAYVELREAYQQLSVAVEPAKPKPKLIAKAVQRVNVAAKAVAEDLPGLPSLDEVRINIRAAKNGLIELQNYIAAAEAAKAEQDDEEVMLAITLH